MIHGRRRTRTVASVVVAAVAIVALAGCSDDDGTEEPGDAIAEEPTGGPAPPEGDADADLCAALSTEEIEDALGVPVTAGAADDPDPTRCRWPIGSGLGGTAVDLGRRVATDPTPLGERLPDAEEIGDLGDDAVWDAGAVPDGGRLLVRRAGDLVEIVIQSAEVDPDVARAGAVTLAGLVLERTTAVPEPPAVDTGAAVDPCELVTDAELAELLPGEPSLDGDAVCVAHGEDGRGQVLLAVASGNADETALAGISRTTTVDGEDRPWPADDVPDVGTAARFLADPDRPDESGELFVLDGRVLLSVFVTAPEPGPGAPRDLAVAVARVAIGRL